MRASVFSFTAVLLVGSTLIAQGPGGAGGLGGGGGGLTSMIALNKKLQEELKVESSQIDKLTSVLAKVREELRDDTAKLRNRDTSAADRAEISKKIREVTNKAVAGVLSADQLKRLKQIETQQGGLSAFQKEDVQTSLKFTDEQKERVTTVIKELDADRRELFGAGGGRNLGNEVMDKWKTLQKEAKDKVLASLTDEQKSAYKDMTGEPFDLGIPTFGGGAGAFGAGGFGAGGPGGAGGFGGGRTPPGKILSTNIQDTLKLSDDQKKLVEDLQKETDSKLEKILTDEQRKQLEELKTRTAQPGGNNTGRPRQKKDN